MLAALLLIMGFSGYESFVSKIGTGRHEDRAAWMGRVEFSDLNIKLVGALVVSSAVEISTAFVDIETSLGRSRHETVDIHVTSSSLACYLQ